MAAAHRQVSVIYVPSDVGSIYAGKHKAPDAIKSVGLVNKLKKGSYDVSEYEALAQPIMWNSAQVGPNGARNEISPLKSAIVSKTASPVYSPRPNRLSP